MKYAVNTNSLRDFSCAEIIALAKRLGLDGIEWGIPNSSLADAKEISDEMVKRTKEAGLEICGFLNGCKPWETDLLEKWCEALAGKGIPALRLEHPWYGYNYEETLHQPDRFDALVKRTRKGLEDSLPLAKKYKIKFVLELHSGAIASSPAIVPQLLSGLDKNYFGIIYDVANTEMEGYIRPRGAVELMEPYIAYVHAKNWEPYMKEKTDFGLGKRQEWAIRRCPIYNGKTDWLEAMFALKNCNFEGYISIEEPAALKEGIEEELKQSIAFLRYCEKKSPPTKVPPFTNFNP
jgi:sugar phosphate isomerase/epimerase